MQYIFIAYIYDQNYFMIRPMKNRTNASMIEVFKEVYSHLQQKRTRNMGPAWHQCILRGACNGALQKSIILGPNNTTLQQHRVTINISRPLQHTYDFRSQSDADHRRRTTESDPTGHAHDKPSHTKPRHAMPKPSKNCQLSSTMHHHRGWSTHHF